MEKRPLKFVFFRWMSFSFSWCTQIYIHWNRLVQTQWLFLFIVLIIFFLCVFLFTMRSHRNALCVSFCFVRLNDLSNWISCSFDILKSVLNKEIILILIHCERIPDEYLSFSLCIYLSRCVRFFVNKSIIMTSVSQRCDKKKGNKHFCWNIPLDSFKFFSLLCRTFSDDIHPYRTINDPDAPRPI